MRPHALYRREAANGWMSSPDPQPVGTDLHPALCPSVSVFRTAEAATQQPCPQRRHGGRPAASRRARPPRRGWRCPRRTARASLQETVPGTPHSARAPNTARAGAIRRTAKSSWQASAPLPQEGCGLGRMNPRHARLEPRGRHPRLRRHPNPRHVYRQPPRASVRSHPKAHPPCPRHQPSAFSRLRFAICMARA